MKTFDSLTGREVLALAISLEEEDARIYDAETPCLPGQAEEFDEPVVSVSLPPPPIGMAADAGVPLAPAL